MSRTYARTVQFRAPGPRSLAIVAVAATLVTGATVGRVALGGSDTPTALAQTAPVVQATPLAVTPEAESPAPETPEVVFPEGVVAVAGNPTTAPDATLAV